MKSCQVFRKPFWAFQIMKKKIETFHSAIAMAFWGQVLFYASEGQCMTWFMCFIFSIEWHLSYKKIDLFSRQSLTGALIQMWRPEVIIFTLLVPVIHCTTASLLWITSVHVKQVLPKGCWGVVLKLIYCCKMIGPFLCTNGDIYWPI